MSSKFTAFYILGFIGLSAFASEPMRFLKASELKPETSLKLPAAPANDYYYTSLIADFDQGTLPLSSEIQGAWAGRCYLKATPSNTIAGLLIAENLPGTQASTPSDNGPLFPSELPQMKMSMAIMVPGDDNAAPSFFDDLSEALIATIKTFTQGADFPNYVASVNEGAFLSVNDAGDLSYSTRKYQNYFVSESLVLRSAGDNNANDIYSACYFFKNVNDAISN